MKRFLSILLVLCLLSGFAVPSVSAATVSGVCGQYLTWTLDTATGLLEIEGEGAMTTYSNSTAVPWYGNKDQIKTVVIGDKVTSISSHAFAYHKNLSHVEIPDSVKLMGQKVFYDCTSLYTVSIGDGVTAIDEQMFSGCTKLNGLTIGSGVTKIESAAMIDTDPRVIVYHGSEDDWDDVNDGAGLENVMFEEDFSKLTGQSGSAIWSYDPTTFTVTITGGATKDYRGSTSDPLPWEAHKQVVRTVVLEDGVIGIGEMTFRDHKYLNTVYIPATVTEIEANAFYLSSSIRRVYYGSSVDSWAQITIGEGNETLTNALFYYEGECAHSIENPVYTTAEGETHTVTVKCKTCDKVLRTEGPEDCVDANADLKCDKCGGPVAEVTEDPCAHENTSTTYEPNGDETHDKIITCTAEDCGEVVDTVIEDCTDADHDLKCDVCGGAVGGCDHETTQENIICNDDGTHTIEVYCLVEDCELNGEPVSSETVACVDTDGDYVCDVCEGDVENVQWSYTASTGTLTVYGKGAMDDYARGSSVPWYSVRSNIKKVIIEDGITHIGTYSFYYCLNLTDVTIAKSVTSIGNYAFYYCGKLANVTYTGSQTEWEEITIGLYNEALTEAEVSVTCYHEVTEERITANDDGTHTVVTVCQNPECGEEINPRTTECNSDKTVYVPGEGLHTVEHRCSVCNQLIDSEAEVCRGVETLIYNGDRTHDVAQVCALCENVLSSKNVACTVKTTNVKAEEYGKHIMTEVCTVCNAQLSQKIVDCSEETTYVQTTAGKHNVVVSCSVCDTTLSTAEVKCPDEALIMTITSDAENKTHTHVTTCNQCKGVVDTVTSDCVGDAVHTPGENGKHTTTVTCLVCKQLISEAVVDCTTAATITPNADRTHTTTHTCTDCKTVVSSETAPCVDGEDEDENCDICGVNLHCDHLTFVRAYNSNGDHLTHTYAYNCAVCGIEMDPIAEQDCVGVDGKTCDLCGQDYSCQHLETDQKVVTEYEPTEKTDVYTHKEYTVVYCQSDRCYLTDKIVSKTEVKEENCADAGGDDKCDKCGRDMVCGHENTKTTNTHNGHETHRLTVVCNICGDTLVDMDVNCTYATLGQPCVICKGVCDHEYRYTYLTRTDVEEQHYVERDCVYCAYKLPTLTETCVDVTVDATETTQATIHDGICDKCDGVVKCTHEAKVAYEKIEGEEAHNVIKTCATCGAASACDTCAEFIEETVKTLCVDEDHDLVCDLCEDAVSCTCDGEENRYETNNDGTHKEYCQYCDELLCEDAECFDADGDFYCDGCGYDLAAIRIVGKNAYDTLDKAMVAAVDGDEIIVREKAVVEGINNDWDKDVTVTTAAVDENYSIVVKGKLTISNGTFNIGGVYGIGVNETGDVTISGGEFNAEEVSDYLIGNWGTLNISGGQFNGVYCAVNNFAGTTTITGGTFSTEETDFSGEYESFDLLADAGMTVSGGLYSKAVDAALIAEGYECVAKQDGSYIVREKTDKIDVAGVNMTLGNDLKMNFLIKAADMKEGYTVRVTQEGKEPVILTPTRYNAASWSVAYSVAAKEMTDVLTVEVIDAEGYVTSNPFTRTIKQYAMTLMGNDTSSDALKSVIVDMLNYGTEAQKYFKYNEDRYANADLTLGQQEQYATGEVICADNRVSGKNFVGSNVSLESSILLNVYFRNVKAEELSKLTAKVTYVDYKGVAQEDDCKVEMFNSAQCKVIVDKIVLADAKNVVDVVLYKDGVEFGNCSDSVESYVARNLNNATVGAISMSIIKFATSAYNYLGGTN